jgi:hypothetical protein
MRENMVSSDWETHRIHYFAKFCISFFYHCNVNMVGKTETIAFTSCDPEKLHNFET